MFRNYLKSAFRNLAKNKVHSFINLAGLAIGMSLAIIIGLWTYDEISFDRYHQNYRSIAQVMQSQVLNNEIKTQVQVPIPLGEYLRSAYGSYFKSIVMSSNNEDHILAAGENKFTRTGNYMEAGAPDLFTLQMIQGSRDGLKNPSGLLLCQSVATALFGSTNAIGQVVKMDDQTNLTVTGVYEDLPANTTLNKTLFIAPWQQMKHLQNNLHNWGNNNWQVFVQIAGNTDFNSISEKIKNAKSANADNGEQRFKPVIFLQPMSRWHLYSEFKNGVNTGGRIDYVYLFVIIGIFVLLLACINFMNLSTARSEKRAREVGIRKAIGGLRSQLIYQFFGESVLTAFMAFVLSVGLVAVSLPFFNDVAGKQISLPWGNVAFWGIYVGFAIFTGVIAGSYPALYLSSFRPVKVLKGEFKAGRRAALPRQVMVVLQFTVSVILIIGTIVVFRQVQYAKNRPVGYSRDGLAAIEVITPELHDHFDAFRQDLLKTSLVENVAASSSPVTETRNEQSGFDWQGKEKSGNTQNFITTGVSKEYGNTIGWQFVAGRDYRSGPEGADAQSFVINESAAKMMGFANPVGQQVHWMGYTFTIIGVVKDMVMASPFDPVEPAIFYMAPWRINVYNVRLNPHATAARAIPAIEAIFKKYSPQQPFSYKFADDEYARKFAAEERIGTLAGFFAALAVFISCLGLFGMASFMAEQRIKEIGVRKVLGASVPGLWGLLSKDFVALVCIALLIAIPAGYLFMHNWLQRYEYRTGLAWWIFASAAAGALFITLATVSYQSIKAALANPVKALRSE
ncbi:MAG TPA: ABC transporter permease [Chitinophagaceae bacterium]|nr:ABC transporter permease [Chitinophagaceae bacterium]